MRRWLKIGSYQNRVGHVAVVGFHHGPLDGAPNDLVPVRRHNVEHYEFMLKNFRVGLIVDEFQSRARTPDVVAVGGAIAVEPTPVLLQHGGAYAFRVLLDDFAAERLYDQLRDCFVASFV